MANTAAKKKPLILVSQDYDPKAWETLESGESEFESWAAVAQDLWGLGCYGPGQHDAMLQALNGVAIHKSKVVGVIGSTLGGIGIIAEENNAYIDVMDCNTELLQKPPQPPADAKGGKFLKSLGWDPNKIQMPAARYHGLVCAGAISLAPNLADAVQSLTAAVKPGGFLFIDEIFATDPSAAALIAQGIARATEKLHLRPQDEIVKALQGASLELRSNAASAEPVMDAIRKGLLGGKDIAQILTTIPAPFRKQRMMAFVGELQRAAVLFQALEKGLATAARLIFRKAGDL